MGLYDREEDVPGVQSVEIPSGSISRGLRDATRLVEYLDDLLPGSFSSWFRILAP